jgi:Protein of unknown function (DUF1236)
MRASTLITISTVALLMGGTGLAIGQGGSSSLQSGTSKQGQAAMEQGSARSSEIKASRPRASQNLMRRGEVSGERGSKIEGSRALQRGGAMTSERGRALKGARGQAMTAQPRPAAAGQGLRTAAQIQGQPGSRARQSFAPAGGPIYARATPGEARVGLTSEQRARLREMARRELPRVSTLPSVRINAVVPRNVQLAPVPEEIARYYPRFRGNQAFIYRNQIVLVDPATSRIVAVLPT